MVLYMPADDDQRNRYSQGLPVFHLCEQIVKAHVQCQNIPVLTAERLWESVSFLSQAPDP